MDELNENCQEHVNISKQMHSIIKNMHDEVFFGNFFWDNWPHLYLKLLVA